MADRIRILRLIARLNMGGPALHVSYLTKGLAERGYDTTLLAGSLARGESSMSFVADELGIEWHPVPQLHREISPLYDTRTVGRLVKWIKGMRPQILHTHTAKAGAVGRMAAALAGDERPPIVVHTFHGHVLHGYFDPATTAVFRGLERTLASTTTRLIAVSPEVRDDLVALGVAPPEKFSVIRLGIDLDSRITSGDGGELRRLFGVRDDEFVIGWIGRMTGIKRVPDLLRAFRLVLDAGVEARLCLVGDGPDREEIEERAHRLGVTKRTLFVGYQRDVAPYYSFFDALVLPSANEGTPVVAIESLAAGRPVVATRVGGVPDVVEGGVDGTLTGVGDIDAIARALIELAERPDRGRLPEERRQRTIDRYRVERLIDDVDALYKELLSERGLPLPPAGG